MTSTLPPLIQAFSGGVGSVVANAGSYPLDVVATRLQTQNHSLATARSKKRRSSAFDIIRDIINEDGWSGLFRGIESDSAATLLSNFIYFYTYSYLRGIRLRLKDKRILKARASQAGLTADARAYPAVPVSKEKTAHIAQMLSTSEELAVGFMSGLVSRLFSTPLSVITVRLQMEKKLHEDSDHESGSDSSSEAHRGDPHYKAPGIFDVARHIYEEEGFTGFWRGFQSTIILCSNPAITLFLFQAFRRIFLRGRDRDHPTALQGFIGAACSNAIAVSILYPLILIKTRMQAARKAGRDKSILDIWNQIVKRNGVKGLYQGLEVQIAKGFFNQGLTVMAKQRIELMVIALYHLSRRTRASQ